MREREKEREKERKSEERKKKKRKKGRRKARKEHEKWKAGAPSQEKRPGRLECLDQVWLELELTALWERLKG